ncbi:MAG: DMT family transporter [Proteobacteria bacterium]|nr:DMT family transporter [Pseudomonadota bacterium]
MKNWLTKKTAKYMLSTLSSQPTARYFPALSCMIAAVLWGILWYPLRLLEDMGIPGLWSILLIYSSALLFIIPVCWQKRSEFSKHKIEFILVGVFAGWTNLAFILAMLEGEVVRVLLLFYLSPVWAILLAIFILCERLTRAGLYALVLAMAGAILMLWKTDLDYQDGLSLADIYAITSGIAFAMTNIVVRKTGAVPIVLKMGSAYMGVIVLTLCGLLIAQLPLPEITFESGSLAFLAGFPVMFVMTFTAQYGVTYLPIQRSSVIFLLEIIAGAVSAALLADEIVRNIEYIGGVLIISAGLISVIKEKDHNITS